jgi:hypothetical protein
LLSGVNYSALVHPVSYNSLTRGKLEIFNGQAIWISSIEKINQ